MSPTTGYSHAIEDIRRRLHDSRGRKASVMIGAGFSRNARHRTDPSRRLPLWKQLAQRLADRLYLDPIERSEVLASAGATSAALRLAQEYETAFGRIALVSFIREEVPDDQFEPGPLHRALLELPWADVFTTNYDRLLERASRSLWRQYYEVVSSVSDLPLARRPRIVKLHGTLPDLANLIVTEEDYRTYPRTNAPLVATVQASLTENVLCMFGFSGDDPNFLAWSGWLRDEMRASSPNAYLFTESEPRSFQLQLLRQRNITPIPLDVVSGIQPFDFDAAYLWLCNELTRPVEQPSPRWNNARRYVTARKPDVVEEPTGHGEEADLLDTALLWSRHRRDFKGWHVLQVRAQERLWWATESWTPRVLKHGLSTYTASTALFVLRELTWRYATSLQPLPDDLVFKVIEPAMLRFSQCRAVAESRVEVTGKERTLTVSTDELEEAYDRLLLERLRHAREIADDTRFTSILEELEARAWSARRIGPDALAFITYQRALREISQLRHDACRGLLESWDSSSADAVWTLRRAALCLECGLTDLGLQLIESSLTDIRAAALVPKLDIRQLSAEGVALNLLHSAYRARELFDRRYKRNEVALAAKAPSNAHLPPASDDQILERLEDLGRYGCNPDSSWEQIRESLQEETERPSSRRVKEGFDIGVTSTTLHFGGSSGKLGSVYRAIRFIEEAAIPLAVPGRMIFGGQVFRQAIATLSLFSPWEAAGLFLRAGEADLSKKVLTRECLLRLSSEQVETLWHTCLEGFRSSARHLEDGAHVTADSLWTDRFSAAATALSRLVVRQSTAATTSFVEELSALHADKLPSDWRLHDEIWECYERALSCLDGESILRLLPSLLGTPVPGSTSFPAHEAAQSQWDDPVRHACERLSESGPKVARCDAAQQLIDDLIGRVATSNGMERKNLTKRCAFLLSADLLSADQQLAFTNALFAVTDSYGLPTDTDCYDTLILDLPAIAGGLDELLAIRNKLLRDNASPSLWSELRRTSQPYSPRDTRRALAWTTGDVSEILIRAAAWLTSSSPRRPNEPHLAFFRDEEEQLRSSLAWLETLEGLVLLNPQATEAQRNEAGRLITEAQAAGWVTTHVAPTRMWLGQITQADVIDSIRKSSGDRERLNVRQCGAAILRWIELERDKGATACPQEVFDCLTIAACQRRHTELSLIIGMLANVIAKAQLEVAGNLVRQLDSALKALLREASYGEDADDHRVFSVGSTMSLRVSCGRLAAAARGRQLHSSILEDWFAAIAGDVFQDVRNSISH